MSLPHSASLAMSHITEPARLRPLRRLSTLLYGRPGLLLGILLGPPLIWLGVIYVGSLLMLLSNAFFGLDEFSGQVRHELGLQNFVALLRAENLDVIGRTVGMSLLVTLACALLGFPIAYYMARYTSGKTRALFYVGIMLPLWSSYLVRVYAWKLILAKEGVISWLADSLGLDWLLDGILSLPVIGGPSLSFSRLGTFIVFVYVWLPFMILPIQAAVERIPRSLLEASSDLGATPAQTFRTLILPLALPGVVAGSIFTFSLTLGDYIIPGIIGNSTMYIGQVVYIQQGTAGNLPFAAAFSLVPILIIAIYLTIAKRLGAFDAL
ncbi:ABC transporter permease [Aeromonas sp. MR7]|uniref:ABC transporter permease n=1 Tax=Aeromonas sp. MR7 TaxID=2923419 RepID=UPI001F4A5019|nr:ABC transporter permease [Aeromonas sp. MR7]MCH7348066.1 ABC transporter permease [Aeromonas sp. MR7]